MKAIESSYLHALRKYIPINGILKSQAHFQIMAPRSKRIASNEVEDEDELELQLKGWEKVKQKIRDSWRAVKRAGLMWREGRKKNEVLRREMPLRVQPMGVPRKEH